MRTQEQKAATKRRKKAERKAHRERVMKKHPPLVRYAKSKHKKGTKRQRRRKVQLGVQ
jgi:hypothetical protein